MEKTMIIDRAMLAANEFLPSTFDEKRIGIVCYVKGASDEHDLLTEWKTELPTNGERVLLKVKDGNDGRIRYTVGYRTEEWNGENLTHYDTVIGWREIHE